MKKLFVLFTAFIVGFKSIEAQPLNNTKIDGYRPLWFTLGQESEYGYKYSGGLGGTYTMKHVPIAIYAEDVDKTFFVFGGTTQADKKHLLCMIGCFDHKTNTVCKPTVVYDKQTVDDPHDNPSLLIDEDGYIWVFVSGRGALRKGFKYKSVKPYDISAFEMMDSRYMAYPQPMFIRGEGFFHFFTMYTGVRQLYFETSRDGRNWSKTVHFADMKRPGELKSGHYQISGHFGNKIATAFNRHINGGADARTNLYYLQSLDFGKTWTTVDGVNVELPVTDVESPCQVIECESLGLNLYVKDLNFTRDGNPVILYVQGKGHQPGPKNGPRKWFVTYWTGQKWITQFITTSNHNYDSGSLWIDDEKWTVIAPTDEGPFRWGAGGEIVSWSSSDMGATWHKQLVYTKDSPRNHGYVRRPVHAKDPFFCIWTDGNPERLTQCNLYIGDSKGNVYRLPYFMESDDVKLIPYK